MSARIHTNGTNTDVVGDVVSCFDAERRRGWGLSVVSNCGVTVTSQANHRRVHFGIEGQPVTTSAPFAPDDFDLSNGRPLLIGFGGHTHFTGHRLDLRLYRRALNVEELQILARK